MTVVRTFVLLHGAFRGGWSWGRVGSRLAIDGHRVLAPDLPGAGWRWSPGLDPVGLETILDDLEATFVDADLRDVVLVGHSQGGFIAEALVQRVHDRLAAVCHLDAPVPTHGQRAMDLVPPAVLEMTGGEPMPAPPREAWLPSTPIEAGADVTPLEARRWSARLTPLSVAVALDPVTLDAPAASAVPRHFAWCAGTSPMFPAWHTRAARESDGQVDTILDAPHDAPLVRPDEVVRWLRSRT